MKNRKQYAKQQTVKVTQIDVDEKTAKLMIGKISDEIMRYKTAYSLNPIMILISRPLEILLRTQYSLMDQRQVIKNGEAYSLIYYIFGIPTIVTPRLKGVEFMIY